jgi:hypothetical protein
MRLWSLHPKYLDSRGLTSLWREALLAQKVLHLATQGYRRHPQLERFRSHADPLAAIATYLQCVHEEAVRRGYRFDAAKISPLRTTRRIPCTSGQLQYEKEHLAKKLKSRDPARYRELRSHAAIDAQPLFIIVAGEREPWEKVH